MLNNWALPRIFETQPAALPAIFALVVTVGAVSLVASLAFKNQK